MLSQRTSNDLLIRQALLDFEKHQLAVNQDRAALASQVNILTNEVCPPLPYPIKLLLTPASSPNQLLLEKRLGVERRVHTQGEAKGAKEKLVAEAEALQGSTDWAPTATAFKRLMDRWREAGRANRKDDDALWARFKAAQDAFFAARHVESAEQDKEFSDNLEVKLALLAEAEALLPVTDLSTAKDSLRAIQDRYEAAGKVPRADVERVERRMRAVEQSVREVEDARWVKRNPEGEARARSAVEQLETTIADLTARRDNARAAGDSRREAEAEAGLAARQAWLEPARGALRDFAG